MLQQTRVDVAVPYYERFLRRFPDVQALAGAALDEVLVAWAGLGYYSRARNLHAAAQTIVEAHGGRIPTNVAALRALPGIGPYTAGAISSIAFGAREPILDGNVIRVFTRLFGIDGDVDSKEVRDELWTWAARWARTRSAGDANQALMELGATLCSKAAPDCARCPLGRHCVAYASDRTDALPRARTRVARRRLRVAPLLIRRRNTILLVRRTSGTLLQGWWEVPTPQWTHAPGRDTAMRGEPRRRLAALVRQRLGFVVRVPRVVATVRHAILTTRIEAVVMTATLLARPARRVDATSRPPKPVAANGSRRATPVANLDLAGLEVRWVQPRTCRRLPLSTLARKALGAAAARDSMWAEYLDENVGERGAHERRAEPPRNDAGEGAPVDGSHALGEPDPEHRTRERL